MRQMVKKIMHLVYHDAGKNPSIFNGYRVVDQTLYRDIRINKTVTQAEDGKAVIGDSAKTEKSTRTILLDEAIKQCLSRQRKMIAEIIRS